MLSYLLLRACENKFDLKVLFYAIWAEKTEFKDVEIQKRLKNITIDYGSMEFSRL